MSKSLRIALGATLVVAAIVTVQMVALDTDASLFLSFGEESTNTLAYGEERLGEVYVKPNLGHDGRLFYIAAHDPFILDPDVYETLFERPVYRAQRVLLPVLAAPALAVGEWPLVWWMLSLNVLAVGAGTYVTARLAEELGLSAWFGLAFVANPGVFAEINAGGSGAIAWALAVAGILAYLRGRLGAAAAWLAAAALAREAMLLVALGLTVCYWLSRRRLAVQLLAAPVVAVAGWGVYVRLRLGEAIWASQSREFDWPFLGFVEAAGEWWDRADPARALVAIVYVALAVRFVMLARSTGSVMGWAAGGFVALIPFLSAVVWFDIWDISRALLPMVTGLILLVGEETLRPDSRS
ncbi:MAG: hypothetical protein HKN74_09790 [Acidimicrobiia bacterium]|nr:hypothetical protein [Acidimicrobiia bacterium]